MTRITLFLALLAIVFVAAFALGRTLDVAPLGADDDHQPAHGEVDHR